MHANCDPKLYCNLCMLCYDIQSVVDVYFVQVCLCDVTSQVERHLPYADSSHVSSTAWARWWQPRPWPSQCWSSSRALSQSRPSTVALWSSSISLCLGLPSPTLTLTSMGTHVLVCHLLQLVQGNLLLWQQQPCAHWKVASKVRFSVWELSTHSITEAIDIVQPQ